MTRLMRAVWLLLIICSAAPAFSFPMYLDAFRGDPYRRATVDGCSTCHINPEGGGDRNPFGQAFEAASTTFTPLLRAQFPDRFSYPTSTTGGVTVHFSDPTNRQVVVESNGVKTLVDAATRTAGGQAAAAPGGLAQEPDAANSQEDDRINVDPYAREGAFFGMNVVNLPNGKPMPKGGIDFVIQHRFFQPIYTYNAQGERDWSSMLGFDGSAIVGYGFRFGLARWIDVGLFRSNLDRTMEFSSTLNLTRQRDEAPATIAVRTGIEFRSNFKDSPSTPVQPSAFIEPVMTRTINDRVSLVLAPIFAFNTRNEQAPTEIMIDPAENHTISLGVGTGIRLLPSLSLVSEVIPRLWGFKGVIRDRPGFSLGLQKSTFRHTFEFVLTRQISMTTNQTAVQAGRFGNDTFHIGFNIYRKLR